MGPNASVTKARALIDPGSSTSFVSEHLVQHLRLPRRRSSVKVTGIGGISCEATHGIARLRVKRVGKGGVALNVDATILPRITANLPSRHVSPSRRWHHLERLDLADPEYGTPAKIDLILGADIYDRVMRYGRRTGPPGSPTALRTIFGWILIGPVTGSRTPCSTSTCHVVTTSDDEALKKFWEIEECNFKQPILSVDEKTVVQHFKSTYSRD